MRSRNDGWSPEMAEQQRMEQQRLEQDRVDQEQVDQDQMADGGGAQRDRMSRAGSVTDGGGSAAGMGSWQDIKSRFVDDPRGAIAAAEDLVHQAVEQRVRAMQQEAESVCARERDEDESSTEALRNRLLRYQQYCERLSTSSVH